MAERIMKAAKFMDSNKCNTFIPAARGASGCTVDEILNRINSAGAEFNKAAKEKFGKKGEW